MRKRIIYTHTHTHQHTYPHTPNCGEHMSSFPLRDSLCFAELAPVPVTCANTWTFIMQKVLPGTPGFRIPVTCCGITKTNLRESPGKKCTLHADAVFSCAGAACRKQTDAKRPDADCVFSGLMKTWRLVRGDFIFVEWCRFNWDGGFVYVYLGCWEKIWGC